jgi:hypothetical protein
MEHLCVLQLETAFATHGLHWPTVDKGLDTAALLERKSKTKKREFLDQRVTNITSERHQQKGLNLLFFFKLFNQCHLQQQ